MLMSHRSRRFGTPVARWHSTLSFTKLSTTCSRRDKLPHKRQGC